MALSLTSNAFVHGEVIPEKYTCDGNDISPQLAWDNVPDGTYSFALIIDDPDAPMGTWDHWVLFNMAADTRELEENLQGLPTDAVQGSNSWDKLGYGGPCPPDREHTYRFRLYALDSALKLPTGAKKAEVIEAMEGHILDETELLGRYNRPQNM